MSATFAVFPVEYIEHHDDTLLHVMVWVRQMDIAQEIALGRNGGLIWPSIIHPE